MGHPSAEPEADPGPSGPGSVVLDIGGTVGAAIVTVQRHLAGEEIEIRTAGEEWRGHHVAVHRRDLPAGAVWAGVFPQLAAGRWEVRRRGRDDAAVTPFDVDGGRVTTVALDGGNA